MKTKKPIGQEPPIPKLAAGLGLLTSLILLGAVGILATDLVSLLGAEPPAAVAPTVAAAAKTTVAAETPWLTFLGKTILTVAGIVALAVIAPLVGALGLFGLLRRYGKHLGPLIHVEYAAPPVVVGPFTASSLGVTGSTAQPLNLGPSFEDERLRKTEQASRMEAGVLAQLFEDNLKLQEKIEQVKEQENTPAGEPTGSLVLTGADR